MKKLLLLLALFMMIGGLVGCTSNEPEPTPTDLESDGSQDSILDNISQALKDLFD